ncbi:MAG TPA: FHA domain-containing protein [Solirubrobacteraceae bacterium]|jgi:predicted component of type VI protein secretion system|nr:FHA domain-containing protein [Solirubrobacteraceae bacterium]
MGAELEILEGPEAGRRIVLDRVLVLGREADADVRLDDGLVSRRHARLTPEGAHVLVEDLNSSNGTFINGQELRGSIRISGGDELLVGATLLHLHPPSADPSASALRPVPPALAVPERSPDFVRRVRDEAPPDSAPVLGSPELARLRDARVRAQARLAPLALFSLVALVVVIYLAVR